MFSVMIWLLFLKRLLLSTTGFHHVNEFVDDSMLVDPVVIQDHGGCQGLDLGTMEYFFPRKNRDTSDPK